MTQTYKDHDAEVLYGYVDPLPSHVEGIRLAPIQEQADLAEMVGTQTLYFCPDPWAIRHRFISAEGEVIRARCDRWTCEYCGPRKTDLWRQLIAAAEPTLHIVLPRAGHTVEEAARALTTFVQYLRRGSKGRGINHLGARPAYEIEYFAVLERHKKFEESGFHWHVLVNGVDYIPKGVADAAWESATRKHFPNDEDRNKWCFITSVKKARAIGYVTKYLTKDITRAEKGVKQEQRDVIVLGQDEDGNMIEQRNITFIEVVSHARRIRYSRHFFPMSTEALRYQLFSQIDEGEQIARDVEGTPALAATDGERLPGQESFEQVAQAAEEHQPAPPPRPKWTLYEALPFTSDYQEYKRRCRQALLEELQKVRAGAWRISGRVLTVWAFQRSQKRRKNDLLYAA